MRIQPPQASEAGHNGWQETRQCWRDDILLRLHGFKIEHRRAGREAIWSRGGEMFGEAAALASCRRDGG